MRHSVAALALIARSRDAEPEGLLLWNRVLWLGAAAALGAFTYWKFKFVYALEGRKSSRPSSSAAESVPALARKPDVHPVFSTQDQARALAHDEFTHRLLVNLIAHPHVGSRDDREFVFHLGELVVFATVQRIEDSSRRRGCRR